MRPASRWIALVAAVLTLATAAVLALVRVDRKGAPVGIDVAGPMSIWPESPFDAPDALQVAQTRVDGGADRWRLRPDAVVAHFVSATFGWVRTEIEDGATPRTTGPVTYRTREDCGVLCEGVGSPTIEVTVDRLLNEEPGTVWSVVAVQTPGLALPVAPGATVGAGDDLAFALSPSSDRHAAVGVRYVGAIQGTAGIRDCGMGFEGSAALTATEASITVPPRLFDDEACAGRGGAGYVFAYTTPRLTVQTGDPMLEPVYITGLSIVPVRVTPRPALSA